MTLENIKMIRTDGITEVIDGAGILQKGFYFTNPKEVINMARRRTSVEYKLTNKVKEVIQKIKYQ